MAGLRTELAGLDDSLRSLLRERYEPSLAGEESTGEGVRVAVHRAPVEGFLEWRPGRDPTHRLETARHDGGVLVVSYGFAALYRPKESTAELALVPESPERTLLSVENFLRVLYSWLAMDDGGFLFHSAALVPEGAEEAFLLFGPSGAGKTTACRLSRGRALPLNDDLVLLRPRSARPGWEVTAPPFTGSLGRDRIGAVHPVGGLLRLVQSPEVKVEPVSTARAVAEVLSSVPFMEERRPGEELVGRVEDLVREVPVRLLHFREDPSFWDALRTEFGVG